MRTRAGTGATRPGSVAGRAAAGALACWLGAAAQGCAISPQCHVGKDCGDARRCNAALECEPDPDFVTCAALGDCAPDRRCDDASGRCVRLGPAQCRVAETCPSEVPHCTAAPGEVGRCVECAAGGDCPSGVCRTDGLCEGPRPDLLPERVLFRTATESFNFEWYAALKDGKIFVKPNMESSSQPPGAWRLLGKTGLPEGDGIVRFPPPERIVSISGDGTHFQALSNSGVFYRGDDFRVPDLGGFKWWDKWGGPFADGPGLKEEPAPTRGWSVMDAHPLQVGYYEDRNGVAHGIGAGAAEIYALDPDGRRLRYNDWWLPADWSRQICLPDRGTFTAVALSVSGSTILVLDAAGRMFTRLYDFDTSGEDDLLQYSFLITGAYGVARALPAEDWRRQPRITEGEGEGPITRRMAIFQNGKGNAARMLRIEGAKEGRTGFYFKSVFADAWSFEETGLPLRGEPLGAPEPPRAPEDQRVTATLSREGVGDRVAVELVDFNLVCPPARARILFEGAPATVDGAPLELAFHHVHRLVEPVRAFDYMDKGVASDIRAALLLPDSLARVEPEAARAALSRIFEKRRIVNFIGTATRTSVTLREMGPPESQVPDDEKCGPFDHVFLKSE